MRIELTRQAVPSRTRSVRCEIADEQRHRLVARLREQAVADPDRVEAELLDARREIEQRREVVVGRDQRLAVVQVDAELRSAARAALSAIGVHSSSRGWSCVSSSNIARAAGERRTRWGTSMCSSSSRAAQRRRRRRRSRPGSPGARPPTARGRRAARPTCFISRPIWAISWRVHRLELAVARGAHQQARGTRG